MYASVPCSARQVFGSAINAGYTNLNNQGGVVYPADSKRVNNAAAGVNRPSLLVLSVKGKCL
jgi:hypothetical protein